VQLIELNRRPLLRFFLVLCVLLRQIFLHQALLVYQTPEAVAGRGLGGLGTSHFINLKQ